MEKANFSPQLQQWYNKDQRKLPWKEEKNPYFIWLSEIILQQTRVEQGEAYYLRFIKEFPKIEQLANAPLDAVLKLWEGLGYYTRARNLHHAAKHIATHHQGVFPSSYKEILDLKGVGEYTAAAIASFAYKLPYAVVDGNVYRVLSRVFGVSVAIDTLEGKKLFTALAQELLDVKNPDIHNQAIMDFGALVCTPKNPNCNRCVFLKGCIAFQTNQVASLPIKAKKQSKKNRYFYYFVLSKDQKFYIKQRTNEDIWKALYEFVLFENDVPLSLEKLLYEINNQFFKQNPLKQLPRIWETTQLLSHQKIFATFMEFEIKDASIFPESGQYVLCSSSEFKNFAFPRVINRYLEARKMK